MTELLRPEHFKKHTDGMLDQLKKLVEIESPSTHKASVDLLSAALLPRLTELGAEITIDPQKDFGDNVVACWPATAEDGAGGILLMCHLDTVFPLGTLARQPWRVEGGKAFGPGAFDMKASIVMALTALGELRRGGRWPKRPITLLLTSDEETGSAGSRALIEQQARQHALTLCLEPCLPDGSLKTARKGIGDIELIVRGRASHAGTNHADGRNAIAELAHQILAATNLTDYERGTTVNVGVISGGTRSNVVPDEARASIDYRVPDMAEAERLAAWTADLKPVLPDLTIEVQGGLNRPPMPRDALMVATFAQAKAIAAEIGLTVGEGSTGGGSDANFVAPLGVPVLDGLGPGGNGAHSEREHVLIASLPERTALLAALLTAWPA
jgi:glutamate carboxypeptidase